MKTQEFYKQAEDYASARFDKQKEVSLWDIAYQAYIVGAAKMIEVLDIKKVLENN